MEESLCLLRNCLLNNTLIESLLVDFIIGTFWEDLRKKIHFYTEMGAPLLGIHVDGKHAYLGTPLFT